MFSSKSTNSDATPAPIFSRNGERRRLTTQPECFSKTPQNFFPTHANTVTIITSHNVEMQCSSAGEGILLRGGRPSDQRQCRKTARRPGSAAPPVHGVGLVLQRRRNARSHTKRTPWLAVGTHTKSQRTHLTKTSDITQRASRVAGYALVSSSLI